MNPEEPPTQLERARLRERALAQWDKARGEGDGPVHAAGPSNAPALGDAELVQLRIRVIALENLMTALLADSSDRQLDLMREMAAYISPRPGHTPHRLTVHAAARMIGLVKAAEHLRARGVAADAADA